MPQIHLLHSLPLRTLELAGGRICGGHVVDQRGAGLRVREENTLAGTHSQTLLLDGPRAPCWETSTSVQPSQATFTIYV